MLSVSRVPVLWQTIPVAEALPVSQTEHPYSEHSDYIVVDCKVLVACQDNIYPGAEPGQ